MCVSDVMFDEMSDEMKLPIKSHNQSLSITHHGHNNTVTVTKNIYTSSTRGPEIQT